MAPRRRTASQLRKNSMAGRTGGRAGIVPRRHILNIAPPHTDAGGGKVNPAQADLANPENLAGKERS
jgi:hypothetical protein